MDCGDRYEEDEEEEEGDDDEEEEEEYDEEGDAEDDAEANGVEGEFERIAVDDPDPPQQHC